MLTESVTKRLVLSM